MILIYTQATVDYMHKVNPESVMSIENNYGKPDIKEFLSSKGDFIRYYKFVLKEQKPRKPKEPGN
jgi:hypothetical protein